MNEIVDHLYIGDMIDANAVDSSFVIICVLEGRPSNEPYGAISIPILGAVNNELRALTSQLDILVQVIDGFLNKGHKVLVHCGAGIERSPLTVAYYLVKKGKVADFEEAYKVIQEKRPQVQLRTGWLEKGIIDVS